VKEIWKNLKVIVFECIERFIPHKILKNKQTNKLTNKQTNKIRILNIVTGRWNAWR